MVDERARPHREAEPPAGHGVGLGPAVEDDEPVADLGVAQEALVLAIAVEHLAVDLVRQHGDVGVPLQAGDEALHLLGRHGAAAGIVRAVEDDQAGLGRDLGQHLVGGEGELVLLQQRDRHRLGPGVLDHRAIDGEAGIGIQDLGAGLAEHQDGEEHGGLAARHDDDVVRAHLHAVATLQVLGHQLAQGQDALGRRVAVMAVAQRLDGGLDDVLRRLEVGLADAEVDDGLALALELGGARQHLEGRLRPQALQVRHELQHGISPICGACCVGWVERQR